MCMCVFEVSYCVFVCVIVNIKPDLIIALAREADGERDKISSRSFALDNSVSKATTFDDKSSTSAL